MIHALLFCVVCAVARSASTPSHPNDYFQEFAEFKKTFGRVYQNPKEEAERFATFVTNMKLAEAQQRQNPLARFGTNQFADISSSEFRAQHAGNAASFRRVMRSRSGQVIAEDLRLRSEMKQFVDWREQGVVTPVKNQLRCGGCWAFSTTGNIESQWAIAGNGLHSLSEQELISCDDTCNGCHGGNYIEGFEWIINARGGGITSEVQYPYASAEGEVPSCHLRGKTSVAFISSYVEVAHSEPAMAAWVSKNGPLSIAVDSTSLQSYMGGIMTNCISNQVDHAILVVGYNLTSTPPYWIIKNQWGEVWGESGYLYLEYGSNQCLITTLPASSVVGANPPPVPPPGPPGPTPPATPPANGSFVQSSCPDSTCSIGCNSTTFATGECLPTQSGSAIAACGQQNLHLNFFNSSDCSGNYTTQEIPLDQCTQDSAGNYITDSCSSGGLETSGLPHAVLHVR